MIHKIGVTIEDDGDLRRHKRLWRLGLFNPSKLHSDIAAKTAHS